MAKFTLTVKCERGKDELIVAPKETGVTDNTLLTRHLAKRWTSRLLHGQQCEVVANVEDGKIVKLECNGTDVLTGSGLDIDDLERVCQQAHTNFVQTLAA